MDVLLPLRRRRLFVPALVATMAFAAGSSFVARGSDLATFHACLSRASSKLYRVDTTAPQTCRKGDTAVSWNQQGPPGPPTDVTTRSQTGTAAAQTNSALDIFCLEGEQITGGGFDLSVRRLGIIRSAPIAGLIDGHVFEGWGILVSNPLLEAKDNIVVYAFCASS